MLFVAENYECIHYGCFYTDKRYDYFRGNERIETNTRRETSESYSQKHWMSQNNVSGLDMITEPIDTIPRVELHNYVNP